DGGEPGARALAPGRLPLVGLDGKGLDARDGLVESGEEAVLAIEEDVVEGLAGDLGTADDLGDGEPGVADFLDGFDGGGEDAPALDLGDLPARQPVGPVPQAGGG